jgi:hypothetical protein
MVALLLDDINAPDGSTYSHRWKQLHLPLEA